MKTIEEMLADVRADSAQRQQNEQENEKEKLRRQQAVAAAEKDMQDALARSDQEAYHAAEGRLTYARAHLKAFEAVNAWWTTEEAEAIERDVWNEYLRESAEKSREAYGDTMRIGFDIIEPTIETIQAKLREWWESVKSGLGLSV